MKYTCIPEPGQPASILIKEGRKTIAKAIMKGEGPEWIILNLQKKFLFYSATREDLLPDFELFNQNSYVRSKGIQNMV